MSQQPNVSRLQKLLRDSKATTASGQSRLDDPEGVALKEKAQKVVERALRMGKPEIAEEAARILEDLMEKERILRERLADSEAAELHGLKTIIDVTRDPEG